MHHFHFRFYLQFLVLLALLVPVSLLAQNEILDIRGNIKDTDTMKKLDAIQIVVIQNGNEFDAFSTSNGKYETQLPLGFLYIIQFSRKDYVTKKIQIDTKGIPEEDMAGGFQLTMDMSLFAYVEGFNLDILDPPIGKATFDQQKNSIAFDFEYTEKINRKVTAEFERLANLAENADKLQAEFDEWLRKGDDKMGQKKYADALNNYNKALDIFPDDAAAIQKRDKAQAALDAQNIDAELEAKYLELINKGNDQIKSAKYEGALASFEEASGLKPEENLPRDKIREIENIMKDLEKREEYDAFVNSGDQKFGNEDYGVAIENYESALDLFPDEKHPKDRIKEARKILDEQLASAMAAEELEQRYNDLIVLGDRNFKDKNYNDALRNFEEASNLKNAERYPKDKIADIEKLLADLAAVEKANRANSDANAEQERINKEYQALLDEANGKFDSEKLQEARGFYVQASNLKENEKFPKSRITRIDELLAQRENTNNEEALAEAKRQREEERRLAEEVESNQRNAKEQELDEARKRRLDEEEASKQRVAEANRLKEEEDRKRRENFMNTASASTEDAAEKYYRDARHSEERARTNAIEQEKQQHADFISRKQRDSEDYRKDQMESALAKQDMLSNLNKAGERDRELKVDYSSKEKELNEKNLTTYRQDSEDRRSRALEDTQEIERAYAQVNRKDEFRGERVDRSKDMAEMHRENLVNYREMGSTLRKDSEYDVKKAKEGQQNLANTGEGERRSRIKDMDVVKEQYVSYTKDVQAAAGERQKLNTESSQYQKQQLKDISKGKEVLREDNQYEVNKQKEAHQYFLTEKGEEAKLQRYDERQKQFDKNGGREKSYDEYILPVGMEDIDEGVQERSFELGNKMVIERTVKRGNKVDSYRKVISKTGIYYFKNGNSILATTWKRETLEVQD
jgi:tetratricopeptide (TPR) repeat protein